MLGSDNCKSRFLFPNGDPSRDTVSETAAGDVVAVLATGDVNNISDSTAGPAADDLLEIICGVAKPASDEGVFFECPEVILDRNSAFFFVVFYKSD